jgi:hypothetical protein
MLTTLSPEMVDDADQLEGQWGIPVALQLLNEHVITALDFLELCEEAANAGPTVPRRRAPVASGGPPRAM